MNNGLSTDTDLLALAQQAGLSTTWEDAWGRSQHVKPDVLRHLLYALDLPAESASEIRDSLHRLRAPKSTSATAIVIAQTNQLITLAAPPDLHTLAYRLFLENGQQYSGNAHRTDQGLIQLQPIARAGYHMLFLGESQITLAIAPPRCPSVSEITGTANPRLWGVSAQIYSLRQNRDQSALHTPGFGNFSALATLATAAARQGASAVSISPVHAMFSADPQRYSPYAPSSRLFLNALYADPSVCLGREAVAAAIEALHLADERLHLDASSTINWPAAANMQVHLFRRLFDDFQKKKPAPGYDSYMTFRRMGGEALESHARFEALHAHYLPLLGRNNGWQDWPTELQDPLGAPVQTFAEGYANEISFHVFLQWLAAQGLRHAQQSARNAGMSIGLISDLAIGTDPRGSHAWSRQTEILTNVTAGAPPDIYNPLGQNWGLTAFSPHALLENGYGAYIEMLRATLAHAGGIRIDHALGLARMWLVPEGAAAADGAYLQYPQSDLIRLICLEAWRHRAIVIGENLGTVPAGFDQTLESTGLLGISVLWFERTASTASLPTPPFTPPENWSPQEIATPTTHDLPTICGWWQGRDLDWRAQLNLNGPNEQTLDLQARRTLDKSALWQALCEAGCVLSIDPQPPTHAPLGAALNFVAQSPAPLVLAPLEDLLGLVEQPNFPGTVDTHPNWIQRLPVDAERLFEQEATGQCIAAIKQGRGT